MRLPDSVRGRAQGQRGVALSGPMAVLSAAAVALAGVAFVATNGARTQAAAAPAAPVTVTATPSPSATASTRATPPVRRKKVVRRGQTYVEVFNNSGISGLAGSTAARAQGAGWQVIGSDNWYGTIPASTVYYPARLKAAAALLAKDLGIGRVKPLIAPMRGDRLTVILTRDYS